MPVRKSVKKPGTKRPASKHTMSQDLIDALHTPGHLLSPRQVRIIFDAKKKGILVDGHHHLQSAAGMKFFHNTEQKRQERLSQKRKDAAKKG